METVKRKSRFSESQIVRILKEAEAGRLVTDLCRENAISQTTFYKWKAKFGGLEEMPAKLHMDNGPEMVFVALDDWVKRRGVELEFIQPGKPTQNSFIERFNRIYREEVLDFYIFSSLAEVREITQAWLRQYNEQRSHEALGNLAPSEHLAINSPKVSTFDWH